VRACVARAAQSALFGRPQAGATRVLVYRLGTIGDHACAVPALRAIRARHAGASISLVTEKRGDEPWPVKLGFAEELGLEVREYESVAALRELVRTARPEALYYLAPQPLSLKRALRDALFFRAAGVKRAAGFGAVDLLAGSARALRPWRSSPPEAQRLLQACGLQAASPAPARAVERVVLFAPAGKSPVQHWREERFIELARRVSALGYAPVWIGDQEDGARLRAAGEVPGDDRTGRYSPRELRDLVATAAGVVSNDSGIAHLAALAGTPLLVISSARANAGAWDPWGGGQVRVLRRAMNCEGCRRNECEDVACLHLINVEEAWAALSELLREQR
jgi:ADP-heptose:LPS heptosyltransferase